MDVERVGKTIKLLRKHAGLTQKDLAERIGISDKAVSKWERGLSMPDISYIGKISAILDTDTDSILSGDALHQDTEWSGLLIVDQNDSVHVTTQVYDKPLVYVLLSYFVLAGIRKIHIVADNLENILLSNLLGDGSRLGLELKYYPPVQDERLLYKEEIRLSIIESVCICSENVMVVHGRSFLYGVNLTRFFKRAMINRSSVTILSIPKCSSEEENEVWFDENKRIVEKGNKAVLKTIYQYCRIPFIFCPSNLLNDIFLVTPKREVASLKIGVDQIRPLYTEIQDRGYIELQMNTLDDIVDVSNIIRVIQKSCGMVIYCLEEIAWRRRFITIDNLEQIGSEIPDTEYGKYILSVCRRSKIGTAK